MNHLRFADSHCHLDLIDFDKDRGQLLENCKKLGIEKILIPGISHDNWAKQITLCQSEPMLDLALGMHPCFLPKHHAYALNTLSSLLIEHKNQICGLGEIGLDYAVATTEASQKVQNEVFIQQLELAVKYELPIILHQRKAHNPLIRLLKQIPVPRGGVIHAFSGSIQQAKEYLKLGLKLGIGGTISYPRANKTRQTLQAIGLENILLETDAPDMPLMGKQGLRNSPEYIPEIAHIVAELKAISVQEVAQKTWLNYHNLFCK
jgi:TatD DNase family protein